MRIIMWVAMLCIVVSDAKAQVTRANEKRLLNLNATDTALRSVKGFIQKNRGTTIVKDSYRVKIDSLAAHFDFVNTWGTPDSGANKNAFSDYSSGILQHAHRFSIQSRISLGLIPLQFQYNNLTGFHNPFNLISRQQFLPSVNFDAEEYKERIKDQLLSNLGKEKIEQILKNKLDEKREEYQAKLRSKVTELITERFSEFPLSNETFQIVTQIEGNDFSSLERMIQKDVAAHLSLIKTDSSSLEAFESNDYGFIHKDSVENISKKISSLVRTIRSKYDNDSEVSELKESLPITSKSLDKLLKNKNVIKDLLEKTGNISAVKNLFLSTDHLNLGRQPMDEGYFGLNDQMLNGITAKFDLRKINVGFTAGKSSIYQNLFLRDLNNPSINPEFKQMGVTIGTRLLKGVSNSFSFNFFDTERISGVGLQSPGFDQFRNNELPRKNVNIGFETKIDLSQNQFVDVSIAKSLGSLGAVSQNKSGSSSANLSDIGFSVDYKGNFQKSTIGLLFRHAGLAFSNSGNISFRAGETLVRFDLRKSVLKNRLRIHSSAYYRLQIFDPFKNNKSINYSGMLGANYKYGRYGNMQVQFERLSFLPEFSQIVVPIGISSRFLFSNSNRINVLGKSIFLISNLGVNSINFPSANVKSNQVKNLSILNSFSLPIGFKNISFDLEAIKSSDNNLSYFSTSTLNLSSNYSYSIVKSLTATSGIGYHINYGWNKQVGLRQMLQYSIKNRITSGLNFHLRRSITAEKDFMKNQGYFNVFFSYSIK
jgi:hypothetical protein